MEFLTRIKYLLVGLCSKKPSGPLPILVDDRNRKRYDPEDAIIHHGVCRDVWERKPLDKNEYEMVKRRPRSGLDYPEARMMALLINGAAQNRIPEWRYKRYLEGEEELDENDLDDGPWKRTLDRYRERYGAGEKAKLEHEPEGTEEVEKTEKKEETNEEGGKDRGKEREEDESRAGKDKEANERGSRKEGDSDGTKDE
jgi:hypothetical protein